MKELYYLENSSEVDKRYTYICFHCLGPASYTKCNDNSYCWRCKNCGKELEVENLKIQIGETIVSKGKF